MFPACCDLTTADSKRKFTQKQHKWNAVLLNLQCVSLEDTFHNFPSVVFGCNGCCLCAHFRFVLTCLCRVSSLLIQLFDPDCFYTKITSIFAFLFLKQIQFAIENALNHKGGFSLKFRTKIEQTVNKKEGRGAGRKNKCLYMQILNLQEHYSTKYMTHYKMWDVSEV